MRYLNHRLVAKKKKSKHTKIKRYSEVFEPPTRLIKASSSGRWFDPLTTQNRVHFLWHSICICSSHAVHGKITTVYFVFTEEKQQIETLSLQRGQCYTYKLIQIDSL